MKTEDIFHKTNKIKKQALLQKSPPIHIMNDMMSHKQR
jgi:hypothetical protein